MKKALKNLTIKKSRNGVGIFLAKDVRANTPIFQVTGPLITGDVDEAFTETERNNAIRFNRNYYISPSGSIADHLNHSCIPTAKVVKKNNKLYIASIAPLKKGQEVLIDYSTIAASDDIWLMKCNCGEAACRGTVKRFKYLPKRLQEKYTKEGIVPKYILAI